MKKTVFFAPLLLLMTSFSSADQNVQAQAKGADLQQPENNIRINMRPEILGLWGMEIPNNKKCVEYYNFRGNNEVVVNSAKEWSVGLFEYQPSQDSSSGLLPTLVMQVNYENNEKDCSGNQVDQAGDLSQYFVKWDNPNQINFCASEKGGQCFAKLNRILP
ncbi:MULTISPECIES: hypothetical protein [unclassified Acinetobacter]|uniref:hypothetical protein n=1 Tax=unclassified Acinetobacter TaxID=196816 RepID=UPI00044C485B|nr:MULTISPECIES: hypothetical protein [unclassified Acinetobacter]EZQ01004.1 signal peptide protein [Acinetobacter sp. Ver3]SEL41872.1 hypothetical protein SAMN05216500_10273 [Acinetobacter sp. DSM 11652]